MNSRDFLWFCGLFEGEGCFYVQKSKGGKDNRISYRYPKMQINMTDRDVLERVAEITSISTIYKRKPRPRRKQQYSWYVNRTADVLALMKQMLPHMGERRSAKIEELLQEFE